MTKKQIISDPKIFEDETNNLLFNMMGGLLPKDLSHREVELLKAKYGENWFSELGYSEDEYERPNENI